ncbi:hypothetical protein IEQ34_013848 [Dendrobium chrysotoxum]|uniref:Peptidase A1 domain-containing protein n=1 Tax=Dendrobium chrysotoxum TaxID=161865 RepID=A0AAV7GS35_DENCH|nr:hypothetical protein IEQ34_013848 [Dendrobium chrysotoxum]
MVQSFLPMVPMAQCEASLGFGFQTEGQWQDGGAVREVDIEVSFETGERLGFTSSNPKAAIFADPSAAHKLRFHRNVSLTVTLAVGTPPQNVTMVLDTGSELSWLLCDNGSLSKFRPTASSSYTPIPCSSPTCKSQTRDLPNLSTCDSATHNCHVSLSYADASTAEGTLVSDLFLVGSQPARRTAFGCMSSAYSAAAGDTTAAGMLGMNRGALSFIAQTNTPRFSYCISDRDAGVLLLGTANLLHLNYTPLVQISLPLPYFDRVAYSVQLETIRVGAKTLPIPKSVLLPDHTGAGQTMVDSGTQFSFLLGQAYEILKDEFLRQTKGVLTPEPGMCFRGRSICASGRQTWPRRRQYGISRRWCWDSKGRKWRSTVSDCCTTWKGREGK